MSSKQPKPGVPPCPKCQSRAKVNAQGTSGYYHCGRCMMFFDDDPNEGGDYSTFNPAARLERADRKRGRDRR